MRVLVGAIVIGALVASASSGPVSLSQQAQNTLTAIDSVPTRQQLDNALTTPSMTPLENLAALATDASSDVGIRLRAIHALAKYCAASPCTTSDAAHGALITVIDTDSHELTGSNVLILRAAIETLGMMRISADADYLLQKSLLDHPSRDIRASTAEALQNICSTSPTVTAALRVRQSRELTEQVKLAISEALRILGQCSSN